MCTNRMKFNVILKYVPKGNVLTHTHIYTHTYTYTHIYTVVEAYMYVVGCAGVDMWGRC